MMRIVCENHIDLDWPDQCSCGAGMPLTPRNLAGLYAFMLNPQQENATMSNVAPERMPDPLPQTLPNDPVEAQDIKAAEEAYARADAGVDAEDKPIKKPKAKAATTKQPVKRSAKR